MSLIARSLQLFFIDGRPDGMLTAEVFNWTGHVLRIPRTQLPEGLKRPEAKFTGVYVLIGEVDGAPLAYVGEAENMASRLRTHAASKDWWETCILITTSANNLHKAHVRYLESRLVSIANDVAAMPLENGNQPSGSSLSEANRANMESFLDRLMMADFAFSSPSAAADIVAGRSTNGRTAWKVVGTGQTYAEWEDAQLSEDEA